MPACVHQTSCVLCCAEFQGPSHPTLGDLPNKAVREAAQDTMNAIFDTESNPQVQPPPAAGGAAFACAWRMSPPLADDASLLPQAPEMGIASQGFGADTRGGIGAHSSSTPAMDAHSGGKYSGARP